MAKSTPDYGFKEEGKDLLGGTAGGLLFGTPILYTMEVWHHGKSYDSIHLLSILFFTLLLNVIFSSFAGVRRKHTTEDFFNSVEDGITSIAIGLVLSIVILFLIGRIDLSEDLRSTLGKILLEACIISVGATFANFKFKSHRDQRSGQNENDGGFFNSHGKNMSNEEKQMRADLNDLAVTLGGAFIFAFNVAPTEEVVTIASGMNSMSLLILLISQIFFCYLILYAAGFKEHKVYEKGSLFQSPLAEVTMNVAGALLVSAALLASVGESLALSNPTSFIACVVTLGFPASIGGAAGRLII